MYFSIVVPVYSVEPYLRKCVDSILNQTAQEYELVLVDDGSPDGSPAICDAYAKADARVRVIHQENKGVSAARNAGIHAATGDYVLLLDSDDFWIEKDMLTELAELLKKTEADTLLFRVKAWSESEDTVRIKNAPFDYSVLDRFEQNATLHYIFSQRQFPVGVYAVCIRRSLLTGHRIDFIEGVKSEDYDWLLSVLLSSSRIYASDRVYYTYRMGRPASATHNIDLKHLKDLLATVSKWERAPGVMDETVKQDVRNYAAYLYSTALVISGGFAKELRGQAVSQLKQYRSALDGVQWRELKLIRVSALVFGLRFTAVVLQKLYQRKLKREMKKT